MLKLTDTEKNNWINSRKDALLNITLLDDDATTLNVTSADILDLSLSRLASSGSDIELGALVASELDFTLYNAHGDYDGINFTGAKIFLRFAVAYENNDSVVGSAIVGTSVVGGTTSTSYIDGGYYTVDSTPKTRSKIDITALDDMVRFDNTLDLPAVRSWFPCTAPTLIANCCNACAVTLASVDGVNTSNILELPDDLAESDDASAAQQNSTTYRQLVSWAAASIGSCGYIDISGALVIKWYGSAEDTGFELDESARFSGEVDRPVTLTGIYTESGVLYGTDDYTIDAADCPFITEGNAQAVLDRIAFTWHPFSATLLPMIWVEPFDGIWYVDNGEKKQTVVTGWSYTLNGSFSLEAVGEPDGTTGIASFGFLTAKEKNIISSLKEQIAAAQADWQGALETFEALYSSRVLDTSRLVANSLGLYCTTEEQDDGSVKIYYHDGETLDSSSNVFTMNDNVFAWTNAYDGDNTVWSSSIEFGGNALFRYISAIGLTLSDPNSAFATVITPDTFQIQYNGATVLKLDSEGLTSTTANVEQITLMDGDVKQWAIRKGAKVSGTGVGLDFVWIGG